MKKYVEETAMLNFSNPLIQTLIHLNNWRSLSEFEKINAIYLFIRDDIKFGYNVDDTITAIEVLADGYGQCNTKGTLFMACLRAVGIPCRLHGFTIDKKLQKGAMTGFVYRFAPQNIIHSWVEVFYQQNWYNLEAFILDQAYLSNLQNKFHNCEGSFCGYGVSVDDFQNPVIDWNKNNTYIQKEGINHDFGLYDSPDEFFSENKQQLSPIKKFIYQNIGRHLMNKNIRKIRDAG